MRSRVASSRRDLTRSLSRWISIQIGIRDLHVSLAAIIMISTRDRPGFNEIPRCLFAQRLDAVSVPLDIKPIVWLPISRNIPRSSRFTVDLFTGLKRKQSLHERIVHEGSGKIAMFFISLLKLLDGNLGSPERFVKVTITSRDSTICGIQVASGNIVIGFNQQFLGLAENLGGLVCPPFLEQNPAFQDLDHGNCSKMLRFCRHFSSLDDKTQ